jgi:polysaccharide biosynthesis/export protein
VGLVAMMRARPGRGPLERMQAMAGKGRTGNKAARLGMVALLPALAGCATLPVSGPTGAQVVEQARQPGPAGFRLVEVGDAAALPVEAAAPLPGAPAFGAPSARPSDLIGPGDVLTIEIYEAGITLFAGSASRAGAAGGVNGYAGAAQVERLPPARVDDGGLIRLPYVGAIRAGGRTPGELEGAIRAALKGLSQNPQVIVSFDQQIANSVIVGGEVGRPGRLVLTSAHETVSDVVALAGGWRGEAKDLALKLSRGPGRVDLRLSDVIEGAARDMVVAPGDRIELLRAPYSFAVMGAAGRVEQMPFPAPRVTLAEAVAMAGGAHPQAGDAKAIFVFRYEGGTPVVYHLDMMRGGSFFLAQRFAMHDKDLLYVGNAAANQPGKLVQLISQLFSPVVAVEGTLVTTGVVR